MSLPIAGKSRPLRPPTHKTIDLDRLMRLGVAMEDAADDTNTNVITAELLEQVATDLGASESHLLAAAAMTTDLEPDRREPVTFVCCAGGCQAWGTLDRIETLLDIRRQRAEQGKTLFNVQARNCLDKCQRAPVIMVHSTDGIAVIEEASENNLREAVATTCDPDS